MNSIERSGLQQQSSLEQLWSVVFALHPHRQVAKCVLLDAHDAADCLTDIQTHRDDMRDWREAQGAYRLNLTSETLWQAAAYMASERWEVID